MTYNKCDFNIYHLEIVKLKHRRYLNLKSCDKDMIFILWISVKQSTVALYCLRCYGNQVKKFQKVDVRNLYRLLY